MNLIFVDESGQQKYLFFGHVAQTSEILLSRSLIFNRFIKCNAMQSSKLRQNDRCLPHDTSTETGHTTSTLNSDIMGLQFALNTTHA